jgi:predicted ATPase/DNA-binding SARP family transcriptional activator
LLGRPALLDDERGWHEFPPGQRSAVLGYLALADRWVTREELLALFWPDRPEATARGNLRPLLAKLSREPLVVGLERERTRVRWPVESDHAAFLAAHRERRWDDVWRLVEGELLEGVTASRAPEFESWLQIERATVEDARRAAGLRIADAALAAGDLERASEVLASLHRGDPLDEVVLRRWMVALARGGARADALATYEQFVELCRDELGAAPEAATSEVAKAVRSGHERSAAERVPEPRASGRVAVPVPLTPLVGRRNEVAELLGRLEHPACRLLTLVGPGGIGKTRLALEAARVVARRVGDSVRVVDLSAVSDGDAMVGAIASAVGVELEAGVGATRAVSEALASSAMLLVLDNVEHLAAAPSVVTELLAGAPTLRILATSRSSLGLSAEWHYVVEGLSHLTDGDSEVGPSRAARSHAPGTTSEPSEAAALFIAAGERATPGFAPSRRKLHRLELIAARLGGSPLAIELAAAWVRVLDVDAIADELVRGFGLLTHDAPDQSARHASVQHVLDQSWSRLQTREQAAMRRLAVFRGGFDIDAARGAAEIDLPTLLSLVNKSFLRRGVDGRFTRHPLVWRDARRRARAHAPELEASRAQHARYFLRLLAHRRDAHRRPDGGQMMIEIEDDIENVASAWRWAVEHGAHDGLFEAIVGLATFAHARGRLQLVGDLFRQALPTAPADGRLRGMLLAGIGLVATWSGRSDHGVAKLREGVRLAEKHVDPVDLAWALRGLGLALQRLQRAEEAGPIFEGAAACYRQIGDVDSELTMLKSLVSSRARRATEGLRGRREIAARAHELGASRVLWPLLGGIATHERLVGDFARAERAARKLSARADDADATAERASHKGLRSRNALAAAYLERGRLVRAEALACRTLHLPAYSEARERFGDVVAVAAALIGRVAFVRREFAAAESWSRRALERHRADHGPEAAFDFVLETLARTALEVGDEAAAATRLEAVGRGPDPLWFEGRLIAEARRIACRCCGAEVALRRGDTHTAQHVLLTALERATRAELVSTALGVLVTAARFFRGAGAEERAGALLRYVRGHPRAAFETRSAAARELGDDGHGTVHVDDGVTGVTSVASEVVTALAPSG